MVTKYEKIFVQKLRQLLTSSTFDDIAFNCKDGKVSGNRVILSLYSSFLRKIFEDNPNIVSHPLNDDPTTGINITEVEVKDVEHLLLILNTQSSSDVNEDSVDGIVGAARLMEIELKVDKLRSGLVRIRAIPDFNENSPKKKICVGDKAIAIEMPKKAENEAAIDDTKETKTKKRAQNSSIKQQSKSRIKIKSLSSTSTVCPYCNITCKSVRGLQVHVGYIHKNEVKSLKRETNKKDTVTIKPEASSEKSCDIEESNNMSETTNGNGELPKQVVQDLMEDSSIVSKNANENPLLGPSYASGDHADGGTHLPVTLNNECTNNEQNLSYFPSHSIGSLATNLHYASPCLVDSIQSFNESPVRVTDLQPEFPLLSKQQGQGTLICLPKTQLYEQVEDGYSCGICEMKFPNLANLNVHMTYCHGLTILVKEN